MKKVLKNPIFMFVFGAIIFSGITGVVAADLAGSKITYDNTTSHSSKTTVQDAIDDLYDKANNMVDVESVNPSKSASANYVISAPNAGWTQTGLSHTPSFKEDGAKFYLSLIGYKQFSLKINGVQVPDYYQWTIMRWVYEDGTYGSTIVLYKKNAESSSLTKDWYTWDIPENAVGVQLQHQCTSYGSTQFYYSLIKK